MNNSKIKHIAKEELFKLNSAAVALMRDRIDDKFESAVQKIFDCPGRLIVSGMGKSGLISQKIASIMITLTPAFILCILQKQYMVI